MIACLLLSHSALASEVATAPSVASEVATPPPWPPATSAHPTVQDLHREYGNIFKFGNRNAASHLWASFLLQRAPQMTVQRLQFMFTGFCAVSGSPVRPSDYHRYRLTLPQVTGGPEVSGYMYYCCWPCVCDTNDWIRVDTLSNVTTFDGQSHQLHVAVIGNPCERPEALRSPFVQPFHGRGETNLAREAAEVRCRDGELIGATKSDHGFIVIQLFPLSEAGPDSAALAEAPQPGRIQQEASGLKFQDEFEYSAHCVEREKNGFNSGMGEIFRRVAQISPIAAAVPATPALGTGEEQCEEQNVSTGAAY